MPRERVAPTFRSPISALFEAKYNGADLTVIDPVYRRQEFQGPSFFYRWLPFRWAFAATRLTIILIPLLTPLYPLFRSAGPTYRWVVQHRVYRWYRVLRTVEERMDESEDNASLEQIHKELERVGEEIRGTRVPARYGANLFALRALGARTRT